MRGGGGNAHPRTQEAQTTPHGAAPHNEPNGRTHASRRNEQATRRKMGDTARTDSKRTNCARNIGRQPRHAHKKTHTHAGQQTNQNTRAVPEQKTTHSGNTHHTKHAAVAQGRHTKKTQSAAQRTDEHTTKHCAHAPCAKTYRPTKAQKKTQSEKTRRASQKSDKARTASTRKTRTRFDAHSTNRAAAPNTVEAKSTVEQGHKRKEQTRGGTHGKTHKTQHNDTAQPKRTTRESEKGTTREERRCTLHWQHTERRKRIPKQERAKAKAQTQAQTQAQAHAPAA
ncbi:hypothetical protein, conserved in T. vivax [Trypanosoma vivax Y486]|uniref:Uncharacterized protein n=1 Tax=Trypanosoma vivax (strain Y486) TaxID=1055687 RepID=F9WM00_TRYVY|nr:hypothetical protein, conserved in T. vivax [Trypanosoma vivax Y486]|eukprot:CCD18548.1 hypothetical protein, conserved in T. vivax [Trypanosoma vivax Y486]